MTTMNLDNYVVESKSTMIRTLIKELMSEYKGSARYYETNRGYAMVAAKLEDKGFDSVEIDTIIDGA